MFPDGGVLCYVTSTLPGLPSQSKPDGFASSPRVGALGISGKFALPAWAVCGVSCRALRPRAAVALYNLSVSHTLDSSPCRGASGEEVKLYDMPRPLLLGEVAMRSIDGEVVQDATALVASN